jgi:hypothetical protein
MKVYIAGPYTKGDVVLNVRNAIMAAEAVLKAGHTPYIPHLSYFWHLVCPHPPEFWYSYDNEWLDYCDCVLRLPGESVGADAEVALAKKLCIPVYYSELFKEEDETTNS